MTILSKACKPDNFESHNSLKLSVTNIWIVNLSLNQTLLTFLLCVRQIWMTQLILAISLWEVIFLWSERILVFICMVLICMVLVVKSLYFQSRGPVFKNHWVAPRSTQPFNLPRSIKWVPGISGDLVIKSKVPTQSGFSLEAVEPHP